jgi:ElaB/YqjD/DUF883 family membrane-anchored ribosome-binding protein
MTAQNDRLTSDVKTVMTEADELMRATAGQAGERVSEIRSRLSSAMETAKANMRKAQDKAVAAAKATDHTIREHPYESIGLALGVGFLVGFLVGRK